MDCTSIPTWFIALAVFGAVSAVALIGLLLMAWFAEKWIQKDEPITFVQQLDRKRRIFKWT